MSAEPHAQRRGWLRNGNPPGDYASAPRCGAKTRQGTACRCPAMPNGRCRLHGGHSTGPRTVEGLERIREARTTHGLRTERSIRFRRESNDILRQLKALTRQRESDDGKG